MQSLCIDQTTPRRHILQLQLSAHIEFPQLLALTQKLCLLEDSGFTQPILVPVLAQSGISANTRLTSKRRRSSSTINKEVVSQQRPQPQFWVADSSAMPPKQQSSWWWWHNRGANAVFLLSCCDEHYNLRCCCGDAMACTLVCWFSLLKMPRPIPVAWWPLRRCPHWSGSHSVAFDDDASLERKLSRMSRTLV